MAEDRIWNELHQIREGQTHLITAVERISATASRAVEHGERLERRLLSDSGEVPTIRRRLETIERKAWMMMGAGTLVGFVGTLAAIAVSIIAIIKFLNGDITPP